MNYLINASNIQAGGGVQVADSLCSLLNNYSQHSFVVVLSSKFEIIKKIISNYPNVTIVTYNIRKNLKALFGINYFLDSVVDNYRIDAVLTVFGPSYWKPKRPHLCGMARPHIVLPDSPYFRNVGYKEKIKIKLWFYLFKKCSDNFYTENPFISKRLFSLFDKKKKVYTVTNYYHQIYDQPENWDYSITLPKFNGISIVTISSSNPHKNFPIMIGIIDSLKSKHPNFIFRFILTQKKEECPFVTKEYDKYFIFLGKVDVRSCPYIYQQSDIMFQPSLLECFTATYPEAMRMGIPIVTTNLDFAKGICGNAACYYSPLDPEDAADAIYRMSTERDYANEFIANGYNQLQKFDNYSQRIDKLINILENISDERD